MAGSSKPEAETSAQDDYHDPDEIFLDQLKDAFIFFTALTTAVMEGLVLARRHYRKQRRAEPISHG